MMYAILIIIGFLVPSLFYKRLGTKYLITTLLLIILYNLLSFINADFYTFFPLTSDAVAINHDIITRAGGINISEKIRYGVGGVAWYTKALAPIYSFSPSLRIGQSVSVLAFSFSTIVLYYYILLLKCQRYAIPILLVFALIPMHLINRFGVMRESWELLSYMIATYFLLNFINRENIILALLYSLFFFYLGAKLHKGIEYTSVILLTTSIPAFLSMKKTTLYSYAPHKKTFYFYFTLILAITAGVFFIGQFDYLNILSDKLKEVQLGLYQQGNTTYMTKQDGSFLLPISLFIKYMFYPFPWVVHNLTDMLAMFIAQFRALMLFLAIKSCFLSNQDRIMARNKKFILFSVLLIGFIFAQGTGTYGTAMRHQILTFWGLVLLGIPELLKTMNELFNTRKFIIRNKANTAVNTL